MLQLRTASHAFILAQPKRCHSQHLWERQWLREPSHTMPTSETATYLLALAHGMSCFYCYPARMPPRGGGSQPGSANACGHIQNFSCQHRAGAAGRGNLSELREGFCGEGRAWELAQLVGRGWAWVPAPQHWGSLPLSASSAPSRWAHE